MQRRLLLLICCTIWITLCGVSALEINGFLRYSHYTKPTTHVKVECNADEPLEECQFKNHRTGDEISLKKDSEFGEALEKGDCSTQMGVLLSEYLVIGCRVRTNTSKWVYQELLVFLSDKEEFPYSLTDKKVVAFQGSQVQILGKSGLPLSKCQFWLPGEKELISFNEGRDTNTTDEDLYEYYGQGLGKGDCGVTIKDLQTSGFVYSFVETTATAAGHSSSDFLTLIAATPLETPIIDIDYYYLDEEDLNASCTASGSPAPDMKWYLADKLVRSDDVDNSPISKDWLWSYSPRNVTQILSINLTMEHNEEVVMCSVGYSMLNEETKMNSRLIFLHYAAGKILYGTITGILLLIIAVGSMYGYYTKTLCFSGRCHEFYVRRLRR